MVEFPQGAEGLANTYAGNEEWKWTANFEAFDAIPRGIGSTPPGTYRFVVDGKSHREGDIVTYHLESDPFAVSPWDGIVVSDLIVAPNGRSVSFKTQDPSYPRTYDSVFPYIEVQMKTDRLGVPFCTTCSFRPWASTGKVTSANITVRRMSGKTEIVPATRVGDVWVASTRLTQGDRVYVARGGVTDEYGEINGSPTPTIVFSKTP
jgi:hypothetical protein